MKLKESFTKGLNVILKEFDSAFLLEKPSLDETPKSGVNYIARVETDEYIFELNLWSRTESENTDQWEELQYFFYARNKYWVVLFHKVGKWSPEQHAPKFEEWIRQVLFDMRMEKEKNKLKFMFGDRPIKVHGFYGQSISSALAFMVALNGYAAMKDRILIYRIKHVSKGGYRSFSYALLLSFHTGFILDYTHWALYPEFCGLDSGTARNAFVSVEEEIKKIQQKGINVEVKEFEATLEDIIDLINSRTDLLIIIEQISEDIKSYLHSPDIPRADNEIIMEKLKSIEKKVTKPQKPSLGLSLGTPIGLNVPLESLKEYALKLLRLRRKSRPKQNRIK